MRRSATTTGFLRAAALAVVLACAWAATGAASCGDYLHVLPPAGEPPARPPCSCQHGECYPPAPLHESTEPTAPERCRSADALLVSPPELSDPTTRGWPSDSAGRPHRTSTGVFHPPRG